MNFNYINKLLILFSLIFIISCQSYLISGNKNNNKDLINQFIEIDNKNKIDLSSNNYSSNKYIDFYSNLAVNYDFNKKKLSKLSVNSYEADLDNTSINVIYYNNEIYSINSNSEILKFDTTTGKLNNKLNINLPILVGTKPISFSLFQDDFIIGFKSGTVIRINKKGEIRWIYENNNLLNTPIKIYNDFLILLYPEDLILINSSSGEVVFEKNYDSSNIIQSTGGKLEFYYNNLYFILPNSIFNSFDLFLFDDQISNFTKLNLESTLNNLDDDIHVYKNFLVYVDNANTINTFDINKNDFTLFNHKINNVDSFYLINNFLVTKNNNFLEFINIFNGKIFFKTDISKVLKKDIKIKKILIINNKIHIFFDNGKLIIYNYKFEIENIIDLNIKNINNIYNYNNKIFFSTKKGYTYIFK